MSSSSCSPSEMEMKKGKEEGDASLEGCEQVFRHHQPIPDANKRYLMIMEENAKREMEAFSPRRNENAQRMGRLYEAGVNHAVVEEGVERCRVEDERTKKPPPSAAVSALVAGGPLPGRRGRGGARSGLQTTTTSVQHSSATKHQAPAPVQSTHRFRTCESDDSRGFGGRRTDTQPLKTAAALGLLDQQPGGQYHVAGHPPEPYSEPLQGRPQGSLFTKTTPLMWRLDKPGHGPPSPAACTKSRTFQRGGARPASFLPGDVGSRHYNRHAELGRTGGEDDSAPSPGGRGSGGHLSALQQTLLDCGKLKCSDEQGESRDSRRIFQSLSADIEQTKKHAQWLKHKSAREQGLVSSWKTCPRFSACVAPISRTRR